MVLPKASDRDALASYLEVIGDELNVKNFEVLEKGDDYVSYVVKPNFATLGKRLGPKMKATQAAVRAAPVDELRASLGSDGQVSLSVDGEHIVLSSDDLLIQVQAKEDFLAASDPNAVVVLDPRLTPELEAEGLFREVLSKIQAQRKELALDFSARIELGLVADEATLEVCRARADELKSETLTTELTLGSEIGGQKTEVTVDGQTLGIDVRAVPRPRGSTRT